MNPHNYTMNGTGSERVRFFARQLITADDMMAEQQYFRQKLRRHNRFLHGWGVVCGLKVIAAPTEELPWRLKIDAGYALGPYGDEIYVADPFCFNLATCQEMVPDPCEPGEPPKAVRPKSGKLYLAIRYLECETRPVRIHPLGCACDDTLCEYSRIRDDYEVGCLPEPPAIELPLLCDLLGHKELAPCPPCPDSGWVVLAEITLPEPPTNAETTPELKESNIDNSVRAQLFSTALLQEQLIACCCKPPPPPPPPSADLVITMQHPLQQGGRSILYTITVVNKGPSAAENVKVVNTPTSVVLSNASFTNFSANWKTTPPAGPFVAELGKLAINATAKLTFLMSVDRSGGTFTHTAKVTSTTPDPGPGANSVTVTDQFDEVIT
jgi:uncharacterized repeat protein (TIGR01451 family)